MHYLQKLLWLFKLHLWTGGKLYLMSDLTAMCSTIKTLCPYSWRLCDVIRTSANRICMWRSKHSLIQGEKTKHLYAWNESLVIRCHLINDHISRMLMNNNILIHPAVKSLYNCLCLIDELYEKSGWCFSLCSCLYSPQESNFRLLGFCCCFFYCLKGFFASQQYGILPYQSPAPHFLYTIMNTNIYTNHCQLTPVKYFWDSVHVHIQVIC